jgi:23S rRNA (cytidine1920-2'-O)/16S rRNA (cytidine1409-2'-O)-methyltransferase
MVLVKPQFEAGRADVGGGGVVRDPSVWKRVLGEVIAAGGAHGRGAHAVMASPLPGPAGNVEFMLQLGPGPGGRADVDAAVAEGTGWLR